MNKHSLDHPAAGFAIGLILPLIGLFFYYFVQRWEMGSLSVEAYLEILQMHKLLSMILSWCLLFNLIAFAIFNKLDMVRTLQGIVWVTLLYGAIIIYLKIF